MILIKIIIIGMNTNSKYTYVKILTVYILHK